MSTLERSATARAASGGSWRWYPGWKVVAVGFVVFFFAYGGPTATLPMVYDEVMREFGWTRTQATLLYTYKDITGAIMTIFLIGPLVDRFGLKPVLLGALTAEAVGLAAFSAIDSLWSYYVVGFLIGLGQGAVLLGVKLLVSRWFMRNLGLASGVAIVGASVGGVLFPFITNSLLESIGWRMTFASLSLGLFLVSIPLCLIVRQNPSEEDIFPDALPAARTAAAAEAFRAAELDFSYGTLVRQPAFWCITIGITLIAAVDQGLFQHSVLYLTREVGLSRTVAATALSVTFLTGVFARFAAGRFFDALSVRGAALWYVLIALVIILAFPMQGIITAMVFAVGRGVAHGGLVVESPVIAKHVYGPKFMNRVLPVLTGCFALGSSVGPVTLALIYDHSGSYKPGFILFILLALLAALLLWQVRPLYRDRLRAAAA